MLFISSEIWIFLLFSAIAAIPLIITLRLLKKRREQLRKLKEIKERIKELSKERSDPKQNADS
jgi:hypothetical protein